MMLARAAGPPSLGGTRLQGMAWRRNLWVTCRAGRQQPGWKGTLKFWQESSVSKAGEVSRDRIREAAREQAEEALKLDQSLELKQRSSLGEEDQMYNSSRGPAYNGLPSGRQALLQEVAQDLLARAQEVIFRTNGGDERQYSGLLRFRYKLNRAIWTSFTGQYYLLLSAVVFLSVIGGYIYSSVTGEEIVEALWDAQSFILDAGSVAGVQYWPARIIGLVLTLTGLLLVSVLVGIVSEAVERQVEQVTTQPTAVLETNHIVVLNWNSSAPRLLKELSLGIRDTGSFRLNNTIVVLADARQRVMNSQVRSVEGRESVAEVLCIEGNPQLISNLECVSASSARAIVILSDTDMSSRQAEGDACAVCTMLSLVKAAKMKKLALPTVVMEVNSRQTLGLVRRTFGDSVVPILTGAFAAKMTMQAILKPGIGEIFREFLTFSGSEFYFLPVPTSLVGSTYGQLAAHVRNAIAVGLQHKTGLDLLPASSTVLAPGDELILLQSESSATRLEEQGPNFLRRFFLDKLALGTYSSRSTKGEIHRAEEAISSIEPLTESFDDGTARISESASNQLRYDTTISSLFLSIDDELQDSVQLARKQQEEGPAKLLEGPVLICGWRPGIAILLRTLDTVLKFGAEVHILADSPVEERDAMLTADGLDLDYIRNSRLVHYQGLPWVVQDLQKLPVAITGGYSAVVLLASTMSNFAQGSTMGADAIRLQATLVLRDFLDQTAKSEGGEFKTPYFVTEVMGAGSDSCLPFSEFVEIGALDVMAISQVIFQPSLYNLLMRLVNADSGVALVLEPITSYVDATNEFMTFQDVSVLVAAKSTGRTLLIGMKTEQGPCLNPGSEERVFCHPSTKLVLLTRIVDRARVQSKQWQPNSADKF